MMGVTDDGSRLVLAGIYAKFAHLSVIFQEIILFSRIINKEHHDVLVESSMTFWYRKI